MKRMIMFFLAAFFIASASTSCSNADMDPEYAGYLFNADWASVCYFGTEMESGMDTYNLTLIQGRTDSDDKLISSGAILSLTFSIPCSNGAYLPLGKYDSFNNNSYLAVRFPNESTVSVLPIEKGSLNISESEEQEGYEYVITVKIIAGGQTYTFSYKGAISLYDFSYGIF